MSTHWNASLHFGVANLSVVVSPLVSKAAGDEVSFRLLHKECSTPIKAPRTCPECDRAVGAGELIRGWEYKKGNFVTVTDEEYDSTTKERSSEIVMNKFVPFASVLPDFYDKGYWLAPDPSSARQALYYATTWRALLKDVAAGIGSMTLTGKEHPVALVPNEAGLRLYTLLDAKEIKPAPAMELPPVAKEQVALFSDQITQMRGALEHSDLRSISQSQIRELCESKLAGMEYIPTPALEASNAMPDLFEVLRSEMSKPKRKKATVK